MWSEDHLSVRGLKANQIRERSNRKSKDEQKLITEEVPTFETNPRTIIKYRSNYVSGSGARKVHSSSPEKNLRINGSPKKGSVRVEYLGSIRDLTPPDEIHRSKILS